MPVGTATDGKDDLRAAVWSVYFFTAGLRPSVLPEALKPVSLRRALGTLTADWDEHDVPRRRRALMELVGSGGTHLEDPKTRKSFMGLVESVGIDHGLLARVHPDQARRTLGDHLLATPRAAGDCLSLRREGCHVSYDPEAHASTVTATVRVNRPLGALAPVLDPQSWQRCSDFFGASYRVKKDSYATRDPVPVGTSWKGHLFEEFKVPNASFENVLAIDFSITPREINVRYELYDSPCFTFAGQRRLGVLEVDDGFARARSVPQDPESTEITMEKTVVFADLTPWDSDGGFDNGQWLNYTAPAMLSLWIDDSAQTRMCCKL
jgi:hypothetical protein